MHWAAMKTRPTMQDQDRDQTVWSITKVSRPWPRLQLFCWSCSIRLESQTTTLRQSLGLGWSEQGWWDGGCVVLGWVCKAVDWATEID